MFPCTESALPFGVVVRDGSDEHLGSPQALTAATCNRLGR